MIQYPNFTIDWVNFWPPYIFFSVYWVFNSGPGFRNFNLKWQPFILQWKFSYLFIHFPITSVFRFSYSIWFYTHPLCLLKRGYFYFVAHLVIFLQFILWFLFLLFFLDWLEIYFIEGNISLHWQTFLDFGKVFQLFSCFTMINHEIFY